MLKHRVIPSLLLSNNELVKTQKFSKPKYVGDPINAIRIFNEKEVDELIILDIDASKLDNEPNYQLISNIASECFMPVCYGGGIKSLEHANRIFTLGIEKICIQSAVFEEFEILSKIAKQFGSQSVVVSIDIKKNWHGKKMLYSSRLRKMINIDWKDFLKQIVDAGAGEVVLNSVDNDGMMTGMDLELIKEAAKILPIPMIAMGGVGKLEDIKKAILCGASAVGVGSFFVFNGPHRAVLITYPEYKNLENLLG